MKCAGGAGDWRARSALRAGVASFFNPAHDRIAVSATRRPIRSHRVGSELHYGSGLRLAITIGVGEHSVEDLVAYEFAVRLKDEVYRLIRLSPVAQRDFKYRAQLEDALGGIDGNIAEGFGRRRPTEFANFLVYALGSIAEAKTRLEDGILRGHFAAEDCRTAFAWVTRCRQVTESLRQSQLRLIERDRREREKQRRRPRRGASRNRAAAASVTCMCLDFPCVSRRTSRMRAFHPGPRALSTPDLERFTPNLPRTSLRTSRALSPRTSRAFPLPDLPRLSLRTSRAFSTSGLRLALFTPEPPVLFTPDLLLAPFP